MHNYHLPHKLIPFVKENIDKIDWDWLSSNPHPNAIHMLEKNPNTIRWWHLSQNPSAIHILEKNLDKIDCIGLLYNPDIFQINYELIKETNKIINEEIVKMVWHPFRMSKWPEDYLVYDPEDPMDYALTNFTIREIKKRMVIRS